DCPVKWISHPQAVGDRQPRTSRASQSDSGKASYFKRISNVLVVQKDHVFGKGRPFAIQLAGPQRARFNRPADELSDLCFLVLMPDKGVRRPREHSLGSDPAAL